MTDSLLIFRPIYRPPNAPICKRCRESKDNPYWVVRYGGQSQQASYNIGLSLSILQPQFASNAAQRVQ